MSDNLFEELWDRARRRTPRGGLVAITEHEVSIMLEGRQPYACPWPWEPPSKARTTVFGTDTIVVDRPPMGHPLGGLRGQTP